MQKRNKLFLSVSILSLTAIFFSACSPQNTQTNVMASTEHEDDMMMEEMEMPPPLTDEEAAKYQADLPLEERSELAKELAMHMPEDGMDQMRLMFPDLEKFETIKSDDPRNLLQMSTESWQYSAEGDFTVVVCNDVDSPMHVFEGKNPSQEEIDETIEMMHEMMSGDDMMMDHEPEEETVSLENTTEVILASDFKNDPPEYSEYSEETYNALLGSKPMALFFHADWCSTCKWMEDNIKEELANFPSGTKIVKVNFDKESELKDKYNILIQSTIVIIDANGKAIKTLAVPDNRELIAAIENSF